MSISHFFARYRNQDGKAYDMFHYLDDKEAFLSSDTKEYWRRTAITTRQYMTVESAKAELDAIENATK